MMMLDTVAIPLFLAFHDIFDAADVIFASAMPLLSLLSVDGIRHYCAALTPLLLPLLHAASSTRHYCLCYMRHTAQLERYVERGRWRARAAADVANARALMLLMAARARYALPCSEILRAVRR